MDYKAEYHAACVERDNARLEVTRLHKQVNDLYDLYRLGSSLLADARLELNELRVRYIELREAVRGHVEMYGCDDGLTQLTEEKEVHYPARIPEDTEDYR